MANLNTSDLVALNDEVIATPLENFGTLGILITGTWVGTITFYGSLDGDTYTTILSQNISTNVLTSTTALPGQFIVNTSGMKNVKVKMTAYSSGTATISFHANNVTAFNRSLSTISGASDGVNIGNVTDNLKVIDEGVIDVLNNIAIAVGASSSLSIFKKNEASVASRAETDLASTTYTVPTGKIFVITSFSASYDAQAMMYVRLKKQTGGTGPWETQFRSTMMSGGQGDATSYANFGSGIVIGTAGDVFKITYEASIAKGTIWAEFSGNEI